MITTMNAKEKANELVNKYKPYTFGWKQQISDHYAKKCAATCAEECLSIMLNEYSETTEAVQYWKDVIKEIDL